jgi:hypothetical protein
MWCRVDVMLTDVSEERIAIFRVKGKIRKPASEETVRAGASRPQILQRPITLRATSTREQPICLNGQLFFALRNAV